MMVTVIGNNFAVAFKLREVTYSDFAVLFSVRESTVQLGLLGLSRYPPDAQALCTIYYTG